MEIIIIKIINRYYKEFFDEKIYNSSIFVETNCTENPFIKIDYIYLIDFGEVQKEITGNYRTIPKNNETSSMNYDVNIKLNLSFDY